MGFSAGSGALKLVDVSGTGVISARSTATNTQLINQVSSGAQVVAAQMHAYSPEDANWSRPHMGRADNETQVYETQGTILKVVNRPYLDNGSSFDRARSVSSLTHGGALAVNGLRGIALVAMHGTWPIVNHPATNTVATATRAAGAGGRRHVLTSIHFSLAAAPAAAAAQTQCVVRDGATGVGTILWTGVLAAAVAGLAEISHGNLSIVGSADTALTIEFVAASGVGTQQSVSASGYTAIQ